MELSMEANTSACYDSVVMIWNKFSSPKAFLILKHLFWLTFESKNEKVKALILQTITPWKKLVLWPCETVKMFIHSRVAWEIWLATLLCFTLILYFVFYIWSLNCRSIRQELNTSQRLSLLGINKLERHYIEHSKNDIARLFCKMCAL